MPVPPPADVHASSANKEAKSCPSLVPRYATITRHLNVVKITLHGTFDERKNELRF